MRREKATRAANVRAFCHCATIMRCGDSSFHKTARDRADPMDRRRYLRVASFFAGLFLSITWWDVVLRRIPGAQTLSHRTALDRWRLWARRFRVLAVQMGGVLIKLGQFLSIRVD